MESPLIFEKSGKVCLRVRVQPRARRLGTAGVQEGALKILLTAPAVQERANRQLLEFPADLLDSPVSSLRLVAGLKSCRKTVAVEGLTGDELLQRLTPHLV